MYVCPRSRNEDCTGLFLVDITNSGFVEIFIHKLHYKYFWLIAMLEAATSIDAMFQVLS